MRRILSLVAIILIAGTPTVAQQNDNCAERNVIVINLAEKYGESVVGYGLLDNGASVLEMHANVETGTWTALHTMPSGMSCIVATGGGWASVKPTIAGVDS
jgi:hypothetical protein